MLTSQRQPKPRSYGCSFVHDLPTPPSTTESPPQAYSLSASSLYRRQPSAAPAMSAPHRGLPPPAAMSLPPQQSAPVHPPAHSPSHPPPHQHQLPVHPGQQSSLPPQPPHPPPSQRRRDSWVSAPGAPLPPPPQHWASSDESMRNWLQARTEEEKTKQEEERTRQESLRLEQRKIEMDMLRSSLGGGIPPPMIPLVFAGMSGGSLPQAAIDWAQQFMATQSQYPQLPPPPRPHSPESQREAVSQVPVQYHPSNAPPPVHGSVGYTAYGGSPTRTRGQTVSGIMNRPGGGSNFSSAGSNTPQSGQGLQPSTSTLGPFQPHQPGGNQHDPSPSIYFHHWQPPATQAGQSSGGSNRPSSPPGESQKKRKAGADHPHHSRTSSSQRPRSPPSSFVQSEVGASSGRRLHKRHKSDVSWYSGPRMNLGQSHEPSGRSGTPAQDNSSTSSKDRDVPEGSRRGSQAETYLRHRKEGGDGHTRDKDEGRDRESGTSERAG